MTNIATLVSDPAAPAVTGEVLRLARSGLAGAEAPITLAGGIAVDIPCAADPRNAERLVEALAGFPVDCLVQETAGRRKRLMISDMDSTIIEQECIDELADLIGLKGKVSAITERAMRGEIAFEPALRERVALLAGLPETVIDEVVRQRITFMPGARQLIATLRAHGVWCALVSGGFSGFTSRIARMAGFDEDRANTLEIVDGTLTGRVVEPILGAVAKREALHHYRQRLGLKPSETLAVGDGANDLKMIEAAGLGVAFRAKPAVAAAAQARIVFGDLTALLYFQGYRMDEFALAA